MKLTQFIAAILGLFIGSNVGAQVLLLDGEWQIAGETVVNRVPEKWEKTVVPSSPGHEGPTVWYRRTFEVATSQEPRRYVLRFSAVNFVCRILVNGREAGEHLGGFVPFELDVTPQVRPGSNELLVRVTNYQAIQGDYPVKAGLVPVTTGDKAFTAPSGSQGGKVWGICDHVRLMVLPPVYVDDIFVKPSVRNKSVSARIAVRNADAKDFEGRLIARMMDGEREVGQLPIAEVSIPAGKEGTFESGPGSAEKLTMWWPVTFRPAAVGDAKPKLYHMVVTLSDERGQSVHEDRVRFGYREMGIDGTRFCLNGIPMILFGTGAHYGEGSLDPAKFYPLVLQTGARIVRLHGMLRMEEWYDLADELGFLVKDESAIFGSHQHFAVGEAMFWKNCEDHLRAWIRRDRNHPSVVIWSLSNEMGLDGLGKITDPQMQKLYRKMRMEDDTRPMEAEADGDISGISSIVNIHCWWDYHKPMFPEDNYWFEKTPVRTGYRAFANQSLRGKPVYIGEFSPDYTDNHDQAAVVVGDRAYDLDHERRYGTYGEITRGRIEGYRWTGVAGIGPWTVFETGGIPSLYSEQHRLAYRPLAVLLRDVQEHLFGGRDYSLRSMALNDSADTKTLKVRWEMKMVGTTHPARGEEVFQMNPAEHREFQVKLDVPEVTGRTPAEFAIELLDGETVVDRLERKCHVFPTTRTSVDTKGVEVFLYEPTSRKTADALSAMGVSFHRVTAKKVPSLKAPGLFVIGEGQGDDAISESTTLLQRFVDSGGVVVCLAQNRAGSVPDLTLFGRGPHAINFVRSAEHPIWATPWPIDDTDIRWWQGGLAVTSEMYAKPKLGAFRILADGGHGHQGTSLVEISSGRGCWIASQFDLVRRLNVEPMAGEILGRIIRYAVDRTSKVCASPTIGVYADNRLTEILAERGAAVRELGTLDDTSLRGFETIILHGPVFEPELAKAPDRIGRDLRRFAEQGGTIYLKDLSFVSELLLGELLPGMMWEPGWGHQAVPIAGKALLNGLGWSDFRWSDDGPDNAVFNQRTLGKAVFAIPGAVALTQPAFVQEVKIGKGRVIVDQIDWVETRTVKARRLGETILTNLGVGGATQAQVTNRADYFTLDLSKFANRSIRDDVAGDGQGGWTDQGDNDLRVLPTGERVFRGVPFHIVSKDGGQAIMLAGDRMRQGLPKAITGIPVNRKAAGFVFLHGCAWPGGLVWRYVVNYEDGSQAQIPVRYGVHVDNWWCEAPADLTGALMAWTGNNAQHTVTLFSQEWVNPHPEKVIRNLDIVSEMQSIPFIIAITGRTKLPPKALHRVSATAKAEMSLPFKTITTPTTFAAGPTSITIDKDGNITKWMVKGKSIVDSVVFGPLNRSWILAASPKLTTQWTDLPGGSKLIRVQGEFAYLDVEEFFILRPSGDVLLSMRSVATRDINPEEFIVLRYSFRLNAANLAGGSFNGVPLLRDYRRVITYGSHRWEGRMRMFGPTAGLDVQMTPSDFVVYDYRGSASDPPPAQLDLTLEVPARYEAGSEMRFQMKASPVLEKQ